MNPSQIFVESAIELTLKAKITVLFYELFVDQLFSGESFIPPYKQVNLSLEDLGLLIFHFNLNELNNFENKCYLLRTLWLKINLALSQREEDLTTKLLHQMIILLHQWKLDAFEPIIKLVNCKYNSVIDKKRVDELLRMMEKKKNLNNINCLYKNKEYSKLCYNLIDAFKFPNEFFQINVFNETLLDRVEHMIMLLDSLWQIQQYEECFIWAAVCLNESWKNYLTSLHREESDQKIKFIQSILYSLDKLWNSIQKVETCIFFCLPESHLTCLLQSLIQIICHQLDMLDNENNIAVESILPWIILHYIFLYEEDKQKANSLFNCQAYSSVPSESEDDEENIPASVKILIKAHELLGHYGLCCMNNGQLLKFIMNFIIPKLNFPMYFSVKKKLKISLEQSIYCLYGYSSKFGNNNRSKPKYLTDHVKNHVLLAWEDAQLLFEIYKPLSLPSFDSKRVDSINTDTFLMFKKIIDLIPPDIDPSQSLKEFNLYLTGNAKKIPAVKKSLPFQISYIYYLIADYYFKGPNQSWENSIKYYTLDLCLHPNEFNSWVGLAMSTSTLMETWLNNFEPNITEEKYLNKAKIVEKSYQHAINLEPSHLTVWVEYGNFVYTVHSFCSRLLKQESDLLSIERFKVLESKKEKMLDIAKNCFISAYSFYTSLYLLDELQDERWLYQYMLAKIAEKKNDGPLTYLKHYLKAGKLLFINNAQYPKKINHKNPPHLSVEALEVYYRIHTSILKYLEQNEDKIIEKSMLDELGNILEKCLKSPFMISIVNQDNLPEVQKTSKTEKCKLISNEMFFCQENSHLNYNPFKRSSYGLKVSNEKKKKKNPESISNKTTTDTTHLNDEKIKNNIAYLIQKPKVNNDSMCETDYESNNAYRLESKKFVEDIESKNSLEQNILKKNETSVSKSNFSDGRSVIHNSSFQNKNETVHIKKKLKSTEKLNKQNLEHVLMEEKEAGFNSMSACFIGNFTCSQSHSDSFDTCPGRSNNIAAKNNTNSKEKSNPPSTEKYKLLTYCLSGLEECAIRFPEHYKSVYRLAYFYFHSKVFKNVQKSLQLLLGVFQCEFHKNHTIQGLFFERKSSNIFNGIWRIPVNEIDRPGSFSYHMSRCVMLLLEVLNETGDSKMLTELCVQLQKIPDSDKKYLKDIDREQLSYQSLTLCLQCFRNKIKKFNGSSISQTDSENQLHLLLQVTLEIYNTYQNIKNIPKFETSHLPKLKTLLENSYSLFSGNPVTSGNIFETAKEFCRQFLRSGKTVNTFKIDFYNQDYKFNGNKITLTDMDLYSFAEVKKCKSFNTIMSKKKLEEFVDTKKSSFLENEHSKSSVQLLNKNSIDSTLFPNTINIMVDKLQESVTVMTPKKVIDHALTSNQSNKEYKSQITINDSQDNSINTLDSVIRRKNLENSIEQEDSDLTSNLTFKKPFDTSAIALKEVNSYQKISRSLKSELISKDLPVNSTDKIEVPHLSLLKTSCPSQTLVQPIIQEQSSLSGGLIHFKKKEYIGQSVVLETVSLKQREEVLSATNLCPPISTCGTLKKKRHRNFSDNNTIQCSEENKLKYNISLLDDYKTVACSMSTFDSFVNPNFVEAKQTSSQEKFDIFAKKNRNRMAFKAKNSVSSSIITESIKNTSQLQQSFHLDINSPETKGKSHLTKKDCTEEIKILMPSSLTKLHDTSSVGKSSENEPISFLSAPHTNTTESFQKDYVEIITLDD